MLNTRMESARDQKFISVTASCYPHNKEKRGENFDKEMLVLLILTIRIKNLQQHSNRLVR
jgi:hypothetical protein